MVDELVLLVAGEALRATVDKRWSLAEQALRRLWDLDAQCHGAVLPCALMLWADGLKNHLLGGSYPQVKVRLATGSYLRYADSDRRFVLGSAEADMQMDPAALWAVGMLSARLADDYPKWARLWDEAPEEGFGAYVLAYLNCVVTTMQTTQRGQAGRRRGD